MRIKLERVHFMPKELHAGMLYVSEEFGAAAHLCACGCGAKIRTPLGPTEWSVEETSAGPTLRPRSAIGNKHVNLITGFRAERLIGRPSGHLSRYSKVVVMRMSAASHTMNR